MTDRPARLYEAIGRATVVGLLVGGALYALTFVIALAVLWDRT